MISALRLILATLGIAVALAADDARAARIGQLQGYSGPAQRVIARARAAAGGTGWNYLRGWHETGTRGGAPYELWLDPLRYGMRLETRDAGGLSVQGFNGAGAWRIAPSGVASGSGDPALVGPARDAAFFGIYGFFYPGRFDAHGRTLGVRQAGGRSFDVVEVQPFGGGPRELWFDRGSGLLSRMVERKGPRPVITELSDYHRVGPVRVAFRFTVDDGTPAGRQVRQIQNLTLAPAERTIFGLPRPGEANPSS